jgi:hypothetical protein
MLSFRLATNSKTYATNIPLLWNLIANAQERSNSIFSFIGSKNNYEHPYFSIDLSTHLNDFSTALPILFRLNE